MESQLHSWFMRHMTGFLTGCSSETRLALHIPSSWHEPESVITIANTITTASAERLVCKQWQSHLCL